MDRSSTSSTSSQTSCVEPWIFRYACLIFQRCLIWLVLIASSVFFYIRLCQILQQAFYVPELKPARLPLAYNSRGIHSVILSVIDEQSVALLLVISISAIWVRFNGRNAFKAAKSELWSYGDSFDTQVSLRESGLTLRAKERTEQRLCLAPCIFIVCFLGVSIISHIITRQDSVPLKCEQCFTVVCSCDAPFLQTARNFSGELLPEAFQVTYDTVEGRCESAGTTSLELPATCTLTGSAEYECPDVEADSWRHDLLTSQTRHRYPSVMDREGEAFQVGLIDTSWIHVEVPEVFFEAVQMTNMYELAPVCIILVFLVLVTFIHLERLQDDLIDDAVEIQDELFGARLDGWRCIPRTTVYSCCTYLGEVCCCCLRGASLSQLLRVRLALLFLYLAVVIFTQIGGDEQKLCFYRPLLYGSLDECSDAGRYLLIMAHQCRGLLGSITLDDLFGKCLRSIVMHAIILPNVVFPETISKIADQMWNRRATLRTEGAHADALEKVHSEAVMVLLGEYDCSKEKAEEGWSSLLEPLVEAFDPYYLSQMTSGSDEANKEFVRQMVKLAFMQRLARNFEKHLEDTQQCPPYDAEIYATFLKKFLKSSADSEDRLKLMLQDVVECGQDAFTRLEAKMRAMLPSKSTAPGGSVVGKPVVIRDDQSERSQTPSQSSLPLPYNCSTSGCPREPWNRKLGQSCCRTCIASSGARHSQACETRFTDKVNKVFSITPEAQRQRSISNLSINRSESEPSSRPPAETFHSVSPSDLRIQGASKPPTLSEDSAMAASSTASVTSSEPKPKTLGTQSEEDPTDMAKPMVSDKPRPKGKVAKPNTKLTNSPSSSPESSSRSPAKAPCATVGCNRRSWNGKAGEYCCRTCQKSGGKSHGPICEASTADR